MYKNSIEINVYPLQKVGINTLAQHPGRSNLVVGGATDGALFVWDTRSDKLPLTHIKKHSASVLEVILKDIKFDSKSNFS